MNPKIVIISIKVETNRLAIRNVKLSVLKQYNKMGNKTIWAARITEIMSHILEKGIFFFNCVAMGFVNKTIPMVPP